MIYLIKIILFLLVSNSLFANETNEMLFKINNKVFTDIDLEERKEYVGLINNFTPSKFSKTENNEILNDYISSLIFYEYYIQNKIIYQNLNDEIQFIYKKKFEGNSQINETKVKNLKFNTKLDLIRNKIIEKKLNSKRDNLMQEVSTLDLLYNYNLQYIIIRENLIDKQLFKNIIDRENFNDFKKILRINKIDFFYKEEDINDNTIISNKIKKIIKQDLKIYFNNEDGYITIISINKNLESFEGIFVKLINFSTSKLLNKKDLQCNKLNENNNINKTEFKEYEYSKLNNNIKTNLKSINDYIVFNDNDEYNYIILCDLIYDESILKNINFNKNIDTLVSKIQKNFLKKYKNEYKFKQNK